MADSQVHLMVGGSGWVQARFTAAGDAKRFLRRVFVQFEPDAQGNWKATHWDIPEYPPPVMRQVPFQRIKRAVNASESVRTELANRLPDEYEIEGFRGAFAEPVRDRGKPIRLVRPRGHRLPDSFYASVALAYRQAVGRGLNPRQAIAEAAGVSPDVAGRWIYQARKRELIPKTSPGKVTA
jgi:hypothetical protein